VELVLDAPAAGVVAGVVVAGGSLRVKLSGESSVKKVS
jgi:hypothetical protein